MSGIDLAGLVMIVLALVVSFLLGRNLKNRSSQRQEQLNRALREEDYHQRIGP
jgi:hypothetical protein